MKTLNKVQLIGRLGKDPDTRYFDNDSVKTNFPLATNESYKDRSGQVIERTDWHNVVCWNGLAKIVESYVKKGASVYIEGSIRTRSYEQEGVTKYITEIVASEMIMLDSKNSNNAESGAYPNASTNTATSLANPNSPAAMAQESTAKFESASPAKKPVADLAAEEDDDDLPF